MTTILSADRVQRTYVPITAISGGEFVQEQGEPLSRYAWRINQLLSCTDRDQSEVRCLRQAMKAGLEPEPILLFQDEDGDLSIVDGQLRTAAAAMLGRTEIAAIVYTPASNREADVVSEAAFHLTQRGRPLWAILQSIATLYADQILPIAA
jgi:hypothetical protein